MASPKPVGTPMMRARFSWTGSWVVIIGVGVGDGKGVESREKLAVDWKASDICVSAPGHRSKMCKIVHSSRFTMANYHFISCHCIVSCAIIL